MAQNEEKIVQSFISIFNKEVNKIIAAKDILLAYKTKYQNLNPDITETNLSAQNVSDMNTFLTNLTSLCGTAIVTTVANKEQISHDEKALD